MHLKTEFDKLFEFCSANGKIKPELYKLENDKLTRIIDKKSGKKFVLDNGFKKIIANKSVIPASVLKSAELKKHIARRKCDCLLKIKTDDDQVFFAALPSLDSHNNIIYTLLADSIRFRIQNNNLKETLDRNTKLSRRMISEMTALHEISRAIDSSQNLDHLLQYILEKSMYLIEAESASLMLLADDNPQELEFKVALGPKSAEVKNFRLPLGKGISGWVALKGEPILIPDAYADPRFDPSFDKRSGYRTKSYLCVPLKYKNEILGAMTVLNRLDQNPFDENDKDILATFASQAALAIQNTKLLQSAIENERLEKELQVASEIQHLLIPRQIPKIKGVDLSAVYIPCKEVSGDFYDIIPIDESRYIFVVADVSGKGIPGALLVSNMQAWLRAYIEYSDDLVFIVNRLNERITANTTDDRFITFFYAMFDMRNMKLSYVNAGHNPPVLIDKAGKIKLLKKGGLFLGYMPWQYEMEQIKLKSGNTVVMYTDGLVEAMDEKNREFGTAKLHRFLREIKDADAGTIRQNIIEEVDRFRGSRPLEDDFTLIVAKIT